jgi:hypothetical protein
MPEAPVIKNRAYGKGQVALELDGSKISFLKSAEGGMASADVIEEAPGNTGIINKHLGPHKFEAISVSTGLSLASGFYEWIKLSLDRKYKRKDGAVVTADFNYSVKDRLHFHQALINEIGFPELNAANRQAVALTVKIMPEWTKYDAQTSEEKLKPEGKTTAQKLWTASAFKVEVDGMDCSKVTKVDAMSIKQEFVVEEIGGERAWCVEPSKLIFPDVLITMPESTAKGWYEWHQKMVMDGSGDEKTGSITWYDPSMQKPLGKLSLSNLGIVSLTRDKVEAGSDGAREVKIKMYCEQIAFEVNDQGAFG